MQIKNFNGEHISILGHQLPSHEPLRAVKMPETNLVNITPINPTIESVRSDEKARKLLSTDFSVGDYGKDWDPTKGKINIGSK